MFDLKVINSVLVELEQERGIPKERIIEAIEAALATAYRKEYGKKGQIVRSHFDLNVGGVVFEQIKSVVDETRVKMPEEVEAEASGEKEIDPEDFRPRYNEDHHILIGDAKRIKRDVELDDEITFPLETKADFGRIAAQTAKQVIIQKIREAEKTAMVSEYGKKEGEIVTGTVERVERGTIFLNLGRAVGQLAYEEQIPGERYKQGEESDRYHECLDCGAEIPCEAPVDYPPCEAPCGSSACGRAIEAHAAECPARRDAHGRVTPAGQPPYAPRLCISCEILYAVPGSQRCATCTA
jgi:N utilization substance protein A